jgi:predicted  nucleic acid-binding Zn-ribbon protein
MDATDEEAVRRAGEHVQDTWRRLAEGRAEIERQRASIAETERHLIGMTRWIEKTESELAESRSRSDSARPSSA